MFVDYPAAIQSMVVSVGSGLERVRTPGTGRHSITKNLRL